MELMGHQKTAVYKMDNGKILCGGTGSGKTIAALAYYAEFESPRDIFVITAAKKRDDLDWETEALHYTIGTSRDATWHGVLKVDSWNNIERYTNVRDAFFIFDEQRVVGRGAWTKHFVKIARHNRWIMLSATPGDTWLDYIPVFVANGFYRNRTEFLAEHVIYDAYAKFPKVDRYVNVNKLAKLRNQILVDMPFDRHTIRHTHVQKADWDVDLYKRTLEDRWNPYTDEPIKNVSELFSVIRRIVNGDPSRLDIVRGLLSTHRRLIIFYNHDHELEALRSFLSKNSGSESTSTSSGSSALTSELVVAEWNGHKHESLPTSDDWVYLVQYTAGAEAWNCITTDALCFYSLSYSYKQFQQAFGRIDRLNTPFTDLHYYVIQSDAPLDRAIAKALDEKRNFNERAFVKSQIAAN